MMHRPMKPAFVLVMLLSISVNARELPSNDAIFNFENPDGAWWVHAINLPAAWLITRGRQDVLIAIVDDGVQLDHEEYAGRIVRPASYFNDAGAMIEEDFFDDSYQTHGTAVASAAAANADNGVRTVGVCPHCSAMPIQTRSVLGLGNLGSTLWGILHALQSGAKIINISLEGGEYGDLRKAFHEPSTRSGAIEALVQGRGEYLDIYYSESGGHDLQNLSLHDFFEVAEQYGVLIVVGAGDSAIPGDLNPICFHAVTFCVGSITRRDDRSLAPSNISNYGFMAQVSAPGELIYTPKFDSEATDSYTWVRGTSIASPMVAGLAGLVLSEHPSLGPADL